jgi:hypothetical protein
MSDFYDTDFGFRDMSPGALAALADRGGVLGSTGYGFALPLAAAPHDGWGMKIISRGGRGNQGVGILIGMTPENRSRLRAGKAAKLAAEYGVSYDMADTILGTRCPYVMEPAVITAALAEWDSPAWNYFRSNYFRSTREWLAEYGIAEYGLTEPRLRAMIAICERLWRSFSRPSGNCRRTRT